MTCGSHIKRKGHGLGLRVGVCGLGQIGRQRLLALLAQDSLTSVSTFDVDSSATGELSEAVFTAQSFDDLLDRSPDGVVISVPHDASSGLATAAASRGIRVLVEKPLGCTFEQAQLIAGKLGSSMVSVGLNYRFMPGIGAIRDDLERGFFGDLIKIELRLGHGGSPETFNSWKNEPSKVGGGALLDPGIHLLDLLANRVLLSDEVCFETAVSWKGFWGLGFEEHVQLLGFSSETVIALESSLVRWRTAFEINVLGTEGYGAVAGRGRSDGPQRYTRGKRWAWKSGNTQREEEEVFEFGRHDSSLFSETRAWLQGASGLCTVPEFVRAMRLYDAGRQLILD